jgi:uncharacterized protein YcbK (DUF882 family)
MGRRWGASAHLFIVLPCEGLWWLGMEYTADSWPYERWPNFRPAELACSETGICDMSPQFMDKVQCLRDELGPLRITSGYRSTRHPVEAKKDVPGSHTFGRAVDVAIAGAEAFELLALAAKIGFTGIGIQQRGDGRFVHLDDLGAEFHAPRPWVWSY